MAGTGIIEGLQQAYSWLSGQRQLPEDHVIRHLTRMNLYAPLLQSGLRPDQIEYLLQNPGQLGDAFNSAAAASLNVPGENAAYQAMLSSLGKSLTGGGIKSGGGVGAITSVVGLVAWVASAAWKGSEDCVDGVSYQWFNQHKKSLSDDIEALKRILHDGMDYVRDGKAQKHGVSMVGATPIGIPQEQITTRRRFVEWVYKFLQGHVTLPNANLLTLYPKISCMLNNINLQPTEQTRDEAASVFYASIVEQAQVLTKLMHDLGWDNSLRLLCHIEGCEITEQPSSGAAPPVLKAKCKVFTAQGKWQSWPCSGLVQWLSGQAARYHNNKKTDVTQQYAWWHQVLQKLTLESLTRYVKIFTAFSAGERVVGTTNVFYQGDRDKSIRRAIEARLALPELAPNPEKWAQTWSFPRNQKLTVNLALLDTMRRMRSLLPVGASQVDPGAAAAEQEQALSDEAYLQQQNDMLAVAQEQERKKKLLVKGATWSIGGIALLVGGIVVYKLLTGKKAVAALPPAPMPAALPATAKNPWHGPMFPYRGLPESDIPGADVEIDYDVASRMLDWHGGQGDPIYAAGSSALAGMPVPANVAQSAVWELSRLYNRSDVRGEDREELAGILDYFMIEHGIEG